MRADLRGHTADDKSERSNPASGQPDLRDKLVLCKDKKALRLQPGLATGFVRVNAHHPATGVPACRVSGFPFCAFCLCGSERYACAHGLTPKRKQLNFDYDAMPAAGKGSTDTAVIFKPDYAR